MGGVPLDNWHHFAVLSSLHEEGVVSYGDKLALEAVSRAITDESEFSIVGGPGFGSGYVHSGDMVALRSIQGYIDGKHGETRLSLGPDGHYGPNNLMQIKKVW